ncbi:MAG: outer membrane beta-barrel protein [Prolixibacteraceae bacterium]
MKRPWKTESEYLFRTFLFLLFICFTLITNSQELDTIVPIDKDPEEILKNIDPREIVQDEFSLWEDNFSGHWAGVHFGFNTFLNRDYSGYASEFMQNDFWRSNSMYINIVQQSLGLQRIRNTTGLVTGLGLHLQSYRLDKNTTIERTENGRIEPRFLYFNQNQKSKLSLVSLIVPLLAEFQIPINHYENRFYIAIGPYASFRLNTHTKIKYRSNQKEKLKIPGYYSIPDFKYGLIFRTGYRRVNLFATYELVPLFHENKGPVLHPFTVGFTLLNF